MQCTLTFSTWSGMDEELDLPSFVDAFEAAEKVISQYVEDTIADGTVTERSAKLMRRGYSMSGHPSTPSLKGSRKAKKGGGDPADAMSLALANLEAELDPNAEADPLAA